MNHKINEAKHRMISFKSHIQNHFLWCLITLAVWILCMKKISRSFAKKCDINSGHFYEINNVWWFFYIVFKDQFERNMWKFVSLNQIWQYLIAFPRKWYLVRINVRYFHEISRNFMKINRQFLTKIYERAPFERVSCIAKSVQKLCD